MEHRIEYIKTMDDEPNICWDSDLQEAIENDHKNNHCLGDKVLDCIGREWILVRSMEFSHSQDQVWQTLDYKP